MRINAINTARDYTADYHRYEVMLDGQIVRDCVMADDVKGECVQIVVGADGIELNDLGTGPRVRLLTGRVSIRRTSTPLTLRYSEEYLKIFTANGHRFARPQ